MSLYDALKAEADARDAALWREHGERLMEAADKALDAINELASESRGVDGLHLNGDVAPWSDLREGGEFGAWLSPVDALATTLEEIRYAAREAAGKEARNG